MADIRLYQFPSKTVPVLTDIVYIGNTSVAYTESNTTVAQLINVYPNLTAYGALTLGNSTYAYTSSLGVLTAGTITAFGIATLAIVGSGSKVLATDGGSVPSLTATLPSAVQLNITALGAQAQALNMGTHLINNVVNPVSAQDAATKSYVDSAISGFGFITDSGTADPSGGDINFTGGTTGLTFSGATNIVTLTGIANLAHGGTSANLTASNGGIFYSNATTGAILAGTATAGKMLRSGATAAPTWSTATFPNTATGTGTLLQADGTNWVPTTATYPGTATGTGTILRADGTNWSATTATYPATTVANQLLYSSATNIIGGVTAGNSGVVATTSAGVPTVVSGGLDGQFIGGNTSGTPSWRTLSSVTVSSITGTSSQVLANGLTTAQTGAVTLTLAAQVELNSIVGRTAGTTLNLTPASGQAFSVNLQSGGSFKVTDSTSGGNTVNYFQNSSNTAGSAVQLFVSVQGTSAGDAKASFIVTGTTGWNIGVDNSDSDKFKISSNLGGALETDTAITIIPSTNLVGIATSSPLTTAHIGVSSTIPSNELGSFLLSGATSGGNARLMAGINYSTTMAYGYISALENGVASRTLALQPVGGPVVIGGTAITGSNNIAAVIGDALFSAVSENGQFYISGATNTGLKLLFGFDTTSEYGWLQANKAGVGTKTLCLNPAGGAVVIGSVAAANSKFEVSVSGGEDTATFYGLFANTAVRIAGSKVYGGSPALGGSPLTLGTMTGFSYVDRLTIQELGDVEALTGNLIMSTAGKTIKVKQGVSNCAAGSGATLVGGTVTVSTTAVATGDQVHLTCTAQGGTPGLGIPAITITNGTSFTITSANALDTSTFSWLIIKAA